MQCRVGGSATGTGAVSCCLPKTARSSHATSRTSADDAALDRIGHSTYPNGSDAEEPFIDVVWWVNQRCSITEPRSRYCVTFTEDGQDAEPPNNHRFSFADPPPDKNAHPTRQLTVLERRGTTRSAGAWLVVLLSTPRAARWRVRRRCRGVRGGGRIPVPDGIGCVRVSRDRHRPSGDLVCPSRPDRGPR